MNSPVIAEEAIATAADLVKPFDIVLSSHLHKLVANLFGQRERIFLEYQYPCKHDVLQITIRVERVSPSFS